MKYLQEMIKLIPRGILNSDKTFSTSREVNLPRIKESASTDDLLEILTSAYRKIFNKRNAYANFKEIENVYNLLRAPLLKNDMAEYRDMYRFVSKKYPDAFNNLTDKIPGDKKLSETTAISQKTLADYKKAAGLSASEADKKADELYAKGDIEGAKKLIHLANKRFSGIIKATNKEFVNSTKEI